MRKVIEGIIYDTDASRLVARRQFRPPMFAAQEHTLWKTPSGAYFTAEALSPTLFCSEPKLLGIQPLSADDAFNRLQLWQEIDTLRVEFPERLKDA